MGYRCRALRASQILGNKRSAPKPKQWRRILVGDFARRSFNSDDGDIVCHSAYPLFAPFKPMPLPLIAVCWQTGLLANKV